jgi:hypothetical protein
LIKKSPTSSFFLKNSKLRFRAQTFFFLPSIIFNHLQKQEISPEAKETWRIEGLEAQSGQTELRNKEDETKLKTGK